MNSRSHTATNRSRWLGWWNDNFYIESLHPIGGCPWKRAKLNTRERRKSE